MTVWKKKEKEGFDGNLTIVIESLVRALGFSHAVLPHPLTPNIQNHR